MKADAVYSSLLRLYPPAFREQYGAEMQDIFRELSRTRRHGCIRFWAFILVDVVRSAARERRETLQPQVSWLLMCAAAAIVGAVLFYGLHRAYGAFIGPLPIAARLVLRGALVGLGVGWAQYAILGNLLERRPLWLVPSVAGGVVAFPTTFAILELAPPVTRQLPDHPVAYSVIAGLIGVLLLVATLKCLVLFGRRQIATTWVQLNMITVPAVILANIAYLTVHAFTLSHRASWPEPLVLLSHVVMNPVAIAMIVGATTARPLWHLWSTRAMVASRLHFKPS
jgi:hypothetical protein